MNTTSKLYTFHELMTEGLVSCHGGTEIRCKIGRIVIPMIQRPYAQGRKSEQGLREKFLTDIFQTLCSGAEAKIELNFIYGTLVDDGTDISFELLDGQQRITTLFLLHWYFAAVNRITDAQCAMPEYLKRFEYQTRTTSTDFLQKLFRAKLRVNERPSITIRKASWYSKSYDKDSTVDSMLRMLDAINEKYIEAERKPTYDDLQKLKFYVLELNGFGLSEELFIKMNARGLQLTPFENFKADLVGYLKENYKQNVHMKLSMAKRVVPYWLNFSSLIDGRWTNIFWQKPIDGDDSGSSECDKRFFRFVQRFFAVKSVLLAEGAKGKKIADDELLNFFLDNTEVERHRGFDAYRQLIAKGKLAGTDLILQLEHLLNFLSDNRVKNVLDASLAAPWDAAKGKQPWGVADENLSNRQMILLSVLIEYVGHIDSIEHFDEAKFITWMRFAHNMTQNTDVNGKEAQLTLMRLLNDALCFQPANDSAFHAWQHPYEAIVAFNDSRRNNRYLAAEAIKARQIFADKQWEKAFREAEANAFMQGSVTFYYEQGMDIDVYRRRTANVNIVFTEDGVTPKLAHNYLLVRALICRDYDWSDVKKGSSIYKITNSAADRHLRNLTIWNNHAPVRRLLCQLLDCHSDDEMVTLLDEVAEEEHQIFLCDGEYWNEEARKNLQTLYTRLHSEKEMKALQWLYKTGIHPMGVWIERNGTGGLYTGRVNCMRMTSQRHKAIPLVVKHYEDKLGFEYSDSRFVESYNEYGNYSGDDIILCSRPGLLPGNLRLNLRFLAYGSLYVGVFGSDAAKRLFNTYLILYGIENIKDVDDHNIAYNDGNLNLYTSKGVQYHMANFVYHVCDKPIEELYKIIDIAYDVLSKEKEQ